MPSIDMIKDYKEFCDGLKPILDRVRVYSTQSAVDRAYIQVSDNVAIMINKAIKQRDFVEVPLKTSQVKQGETTL